MKYNSLNIFLFIFIGFIICFCSCDSVCDEEIFILELKQDLEDNGILDCLRTIKPPNGVIETIDQKNKRLSAQWDTSCAFESSYDWVNQLKKNFGITTLVDEIGEPVEHNLPEQADMCEIIRAIIAGGLLNPITSDVTEIPFEALNYISCPGLIPSSKICAVNNDSYFKSDQWTIMLDSMNIQINNYPTFIKVNDNMPIFDKPEDAGIPIKEEEIKAALLIKAPGDEEIQRLIASKKDFTPMDRRKPDDPWKRVYVRYSTFTKETIQSNAGWNFFDSGKIEFNTNKDIYVIAYSMISGYALKCRLAVRLVLDDVHQISTRMIQGYLNYPAITTGFVSQLQVGTHRIQTQYRVSASISLDVDNKEEENIITGLIVIPTDNLLIKKIINPIEFQLFNDNSWSDFPSLSAVIKIPKTAYVFIMYNLSMPGMQSHVVSRVDINTIPIFVY
jgi:hypothetical protein